MNKIYAFNPLWINFAIIQFTRFEYVHHCDVAWVSWQHQSSSLLALCKGNPPDSPHKGPIIWKDFPWRNGRVERDEHQLNIWCVPYARVPTEISPSHDDIIKWKHFTRYRLFVRGIHRWPSNGQWRWKCFHLMTSSCPCLLISLFAASPCNQNNQKLFDI